MTNLKLVLRTYSALRQMSPDDIALLETLRALNDNDRELLVEMMTDKPAGKKASKKSSKSSSPKSLHATGIERQLNKRREQGRVGTTATSDDNDGDKYERCTVVRGDLGGTTCALLPDHNVHHMASVRGFHPFVASPTAPARSPANGGAGSSTQNSEASAVSAGAATGGSSE